MQSSAVWFVVVDVLLAVSLMSSETIFSSAASTSQLQLRQDELAWTDARLLKRSLEDALQQHFQLLQEAEDDIMARIGALKAKHQAVVSQRKRSHYMCLVNLIACYRK